MDISNAEKIANIVKELQCLKLELQYLLEGKKFHLKIISPMKYHEMESNLKWNEQGNWRTLAMIEAYHNRIVELEEELEKL